MSYRFSLILILLFTGFSIVNSQNYHMVLDALPQWESSDYSEWKRNYGQMVFGNEYVVIQLNKLPGKAEVDQMSSQGIDILEYVTNRCYLAAMSENIEQASLHRNGISRLWNIQSDWKVDGNIEYDYLDNWSKDVNRGFFTVRYPSNLKYSQFESLCNENNIEILSSNSGINNFAEVAIEKGREGVLTRMPFILSIEQLGPPATPEDKTGRSLHKVNRLTTGLRNYTGEGIAALVRDDGEVFSHIDFKGRLDQSFVAESRGSHGDGVAGILGGAGNLDPVNTGMAYGADLYIIDYARNFLDRTMDLHFNQDVLVTNSSYSDGCNVGYNNRTRTVDQQLYQNRALMHVFSAGNDGESDCEFGAGAGWGNITGGNKIGKNTIAVANLNYVGLLESSSSRGPIEDGRIKPDIAANGFGHVSTDEQQDYMVFGGTSAAAPVVAGILTMLQQAYEMIYGEKGRADVLKAVLLNTATDAGNVGPDYSFGWGIVNAHRAALALEEQRFETKTLENGQTVSIPFEIPEGTKVVKIMTYWHDVDGEQNPNKHLINDVDTYLTNGTESFYPWILDHSPDPNILALPATTGVDKTNNMEQIALFEPEAGQYNLILSGTEIPTGDIELVVTWEIRKDEIEITYPNGGENFVPNTEEVIHWDAVGNEGEFTIELLDTDGNVIKTETAPGQRRLKIIRLPDEFSEFVDIRVSRGITEDSTDGAFLIANKPSNLEILRAGDSLTLIFDPVEEAISYNIYLLGDKYMEYHATIDTNYLLLPDEDIFKLNWISVSANFENGVEGERSRAITTQPVPVAEVITDKNNRPCVDQPITFFTPKDTLTTYEWQFGNNATPEEATTNGPHEVIYSKKGNKIGFLRAVNDAGSDNTIFQMDVQLNPIGDEIFIDDFGNGEFSFTSNAERVDSFAWDFGDGSISNEERPSHIFTDNGQFIVNLKAFGECGIVEINRVIDVFLSTATSDLLREKTVVRPNPNRGTFAVDLPEFNVKEIYLELRRSNGMLVQKQSIQQMSSGSFVIFTNLSAGTYLLKIKAGENQINKRVIVEN
jgi:hypothetical protein